MRLIEYYGTVLLYCLYSVVCAAGLNDHGSRLHLITSTTQRLAHVDGNELGSGLKSLAHSFVVMVSL